MYNLADQLTSMVKRNIPFYAYRLPDTQTVRIGWQEDSLVATGQISDFSRQKGFVVAPFMETKDAPLSFIREDRHFEGVNTDTRFAELITGREYGFEEEQEEPFVVSKEEYLVSCTHFIEAIGRGDLHKAILSRVVKTDQCGKERAGILFSNLERAYHSAFVFLVNIPGRICWIGASPETLLHLEGACLSTMSLAGTQKWVPGFTESLVNWSRKDKEEQAFVTEYIHRVLREQCVEGIEMGELRVARAGNVGHLQTLFKGTLPSASGSLDSLLSNLSPTPAVCGTPREDAMRLIRQTERHTRSYYGGYLGPVHGTSGLDLFVNLRSAKLMSGSAFLFVGGGITADSVPEKEWEETCLKSGTILNVLTHDNV